MVGTDEVGVCGVEEGPQVLLVLIHGFHEIRVAPEDEFRDGIQLSIRPETQILP